VDVVNKFVLNVETHIMVCLNHAMLLLTNNLKNGQKVKMLDIVQCARRGLKRMKAAII
jgi:hypothetical protein